MSPPGIVMQAEPVCTERLVLVPSGARLARAAADDDRVRLARLLRTEVPEAWPPPFVAASLEATAQRLEEDPDTAGWWLWYWLTTTDRGDRELVGVGGFGGPPDERGSVDVAYGVVQSHQRSGYATEAMRALVRWAFCDPRVQTIGADTFPHLLPSLAIMERCGMTHVGAGAASGSVRHELTRELHAANAAGDLDPFGAFSGFVPRLRAALDGLAAPVLERPEAEGRWSIVDVVRHLADTELVYAYRMRKVVAEPGAAIEGFDQEAWVAQSERCGAGELEALLDDVARLRARTTDWLRTLNVEQLSRTGLHSERGPECVAWTVRLLVDHDAAHLAQIERLRAAATG